MLYSSIVMYVCVSILYSAYLWPIENFLKDILAEKIGRLTALLIGYNFRQLYHEPPNLLLSFLVPNFCYKVIMFTSHLYLLCCLVVSS